MSGGATFSDPTLLVPPVTPQQQRQAGIAIVRMAETAHASRQELHDALEAIGLLPYTSVPGWRNGKKAKTP